MSTAWDFFSHQPHLTSQNRHQKLKSFTYTLLFWFWSLVHTVKYKTGERDVVTATFLIHNPRDHNDHFILLTARGITIKILINWNRHNDLRAIKSFHYYTFCGAIVLGLYEESEYKMRKIVTLNFQWMLMMILYCCIVPAYVYLLISVRLCVCDKLSAMEFQ